MTKITELTLDVSKWRCGDYEDASLGEGDTQMLNEEGYMCCLGQFAKQLDIPTSFLRQCADPQDVALDMIARKDGSIATLLENIKPFLDDDQVNSDLSIRLITINDDGATTPMQKVKAIRTLLEEYDIKLNVVDPNNQLEAFK